MSKKHSSASQQRAKSRRISFVIFSVFFLSLMISTFHPGRIAGNASGGMGCGGNPPEASVKKAAKEPALGSSKAYLTSTITTTADATLKQDNSGPYGGSNTLKVKHENGGAGNNVRKSLLKFEVDTMKAYSSITSTFQLSLSSQGEDTTFAFQVWGLKTSGSVCGNNDFSESGVLYNQIAGLDSSADGVNASHSCIYNWEGKSTGATPLVTFYTTKSDEGKVISFSSQKLISYIQSQALAAPGNTTKLVLLLTRKQESSKVTAFASKEHTSLQGPRLILNHQAVNDTINTNGDTYIKLNNEGLFGSSTKIYTKYHYDTNNEFIRQGLLKFRVNGFQTSLNPSATLLLDVASHSISSANYRVWGLKTGATCQTNIFNEHTVKSSDLGISKNNADGVNKTHPCLYKGSEGPLGTFTAKSSDEGKTVSFTSRKLSEYIREQVGQSTSGTTELVLLITRATSNSALASFASKEHASLNPPRLKFSSVIEGNQDVCGYTCENCPANTFKATCTLTGNTEVVNGLTLNELKVQTMGMSIKLLGNWADTSANGIKSFKTTSFFAIKTAQGNMGLTPMGTSSVTITCEPYLSIEGQVADLPNVDGLDKYDVNSFAKVPTISMGVRLGQHLREDYPETPFGDCRPYFFVAADTTVGIGNFKLNKKVGVKEVAVLLAVDPQDPSVIVEVGGEPIKKLSGKQLDHVGLGLSWKGYMKWTSAVPLPKSVSQFGILENVSIDGHLYGRLGFKLPTAVKLDVDASAFFDLSGVGNLTKALFNQFNDGFFNKDLGNIATDTLKNLNFGFNINSVGIDVELFKLKLGAGSLVRKNQVTRFAGYLKTPEGASPQIINDIYPPAHNFINKVFDKIHNAANAKVEIQGIIEENHATPRYRVKMAAKARFMVGAKASAQTQLVLSNVNSSNQLVDFYGKIDSSIKFEDFTKFVKSGAFSIAGTLSVSNSKATYSLTGSTSLDIAGIKIKNVGFTVSNASVADGQASLNGLLDSNIINVPLTGHATPNSFSMTGNGNFDFIPNVSVVTLGAEEMVSAAKTGYHCVEKAQQCGKRLVEATINAAEDLWKCVRDQRCTRRTNIGITRVCTRWACKIESGWNPCFSCKKKNTESLDLSVVKTLLTLNVKDSDTTPLTGAVSVISGAVGNAIATFNSTKREVCYMMSSDDIKSAAGPILGKTIFSAAAKTVCKPIF